MKNKKTQKQILIDLILSKKWFSNKTFVARCRNEKAKLSRRMSELDKTTLAIEVKTLSNGEKKFRGI